MSYAPSTFHAGAGEDFFRKEGFLTGMAPLVRGRYTFPSPDSTHGTVTITNSSAKFTSTGGVYINYLLGAAYDKVFAMYYSQMSSSIALSLVATATNSDGSADLNTQWGYWAVHLPNSSGTSLERNHTTSSTQLGIDTTIYAATGVTTPVWGLAAYFEDGDQKLWLKSGTGQWLQVLATSDSNANLPSFQSVAIRTYATGASNSRAITPFQIWGA